MKLKRNTAKNPVKLIILFDASAAFNLFWPFSLFVWWECEIVPFAVLNSPKCLDVRQIAHRFEIWMQTDRYEIILMENRCLWAKWHSIDTAFVAFSLFFFSLSFVCEPCLENRDSYRKLSSFIQWTFQCLERSQIPAHFNKWHLNGQIYRDIHELKTKTIRKIVRLDFCSSCDPNDNRIFLHLYYTYDTCICFSDEKIRATRTIRWAL